MSRGAAVLLLAVSALVAGCGDGSYVIGRFADASCASEQDALLCSGFERPDLSDWTSILVENHAGVEQTDGRVHGGEGALHAFSTGQKSSAVVADQFAPVKDGSLYLRAYLYVPGGLPTKTMNLFFLGDIATPDPFKGVDFNLEDGALSTYVPGDQPDRFTSTTLTIPRDRWFCLQIAMAVSSEAGSVTILVDGQVGLEQHDMNTDPAAGVHLLRAGIDWSSLQTEPFDFYLDDLVLARTSVACDEP